MTKKKVVKKQVTASSRVLRMRELIIALSKNPLVRFGVLWLVSYLVLMSSFFNSILKVNAFLSIFPKEMILPSIMHFITACLLSLSIFWLPWPKSYSAKLMSGIVLALLLIDYNTNLQSVSGVIRGFVPGLTESDPMPLVGVIYLLLLLVLAVLVGKGLEWLIGRKKNVQSYDVVLGLLVFIAYLFLVPAFSIANKLPIKIHQSATQSQEFSKSNKEQLLDKPDIYYIVLDRYTNNTVLKNQFGHDNSSFTNFLRDSNFIVNNDAYSNYPFTNMSVSSTLNGRYTNDLVAPYKDSDFQSSTLYDNLAWQSSVAKALKKDGYRYYGLGNWSETSYKIPLADHDYTWQQELTIFGKTKRLRGIEASEFMKSPYSQLALISNSSWWPVRLKIKDHTSEIREQLNTLNDLAADNNTGGRFIFAHILVPHDPYIFNADGSTSISPGSDSIGQPIKEKYTGQVDFINTQMEQLVKNIQTQSSGKAVIVINSDEGPFPWDLNRTTLNQTIQLDGDMRNWSDDWLQMKFGILQAVYIPKATNEDLKNISSVNIFRIILNRYLGYQLEYLPNCQLGLTNNSSERYVYADITERFVTNPDERCEQLQSLPK